MSVSLVSCHEKCALRHRSYGAAGRRPRPHHLRVRHFVPHDVLDPFEPVCVIGRQRETADVRPVPPRYRDSVQKSLLPSFGPVDGAIEGRLAPWVRSHRPPWFHVPSGRHNVRVVDAAPRRRRRPLRFLRTNRVPLPRLGQRDPRPFRQPSHRADDSDHR